MLAQPVRAGKRSGENRERRRCATTRQAQSLRVENATHVASRPPKSVFELYFPASPSRALTLGRLGVQSL
jgi:hypothetical protein